MNSDRDHGTVNCRLHGSGPSSGQIYFKPISGKTRAINGERELNEVLHEMAMKGTYATVNGKVMNNKSQAGKGDTLREQGRMKGGAMDEDQIRNAFALMETQFKAIQEALTKEQEKTEQLQQMVGKNKREDQSLIAAIRKGQMKDIAPKKFINIQNSGSFKTWANSMKDYVFWHDAKSKEVI